MNETELIAKLAASAAGKTDLEIADVTNRVMASIHFRPPAPSMRIWLATAAASCTIALITSIGAAQSWSSLSNSLVDLSVSQTPTVMP
jgi:hypothetical protein